MTSTSTRIAIGSRISMRALLAGAVAACACGIAAGQSSIDETNKFAWGENIGWTNWRDAGSPAGAQGARIHETFLSGFIWAENVGWINLGDGDPGLPGGAEIHYANATGADAGVNLDPDSGFVGGMAWGENIGWINFSGGMQASPRSPAQLLNESGICRLSGFVWGENIGWLNLDDAAYFVAAPGACDGSCDLLGDLDHDNAVSLSDLAILLSNFGTPGGASPDDGDLEGNGDVGLQDLAILLANFGMVCP